jgi:hypothetical protein
MTPSRLRKNPLLRRTFDMGGVVAGPPQAGGAGGADHAVASRREILRRLYAAPTR